MWHRLEPLVRRILNPCGRSPELGLRELLETVFFRARTGVGWRDLPPCFGQWEAVYKIDQNRAGRSGLPGSPGVDADGSRRGTRPTLGRAKQGVGAGRDV
jgi:transposase